MTELTLIREQGPNDGDYYDLCGSLSEKTAVDKCLNDGFVICHSGSWTKLGENTTRYLKKIPLIGEPPSCVRSSEHFKQALAGIKTILERCGGV